MYDCMNVDIHKKYGHYSLVTVMYDVPMYNICIQRDCSNGVSIYYYPTIK